MGLCNHLVHNVLLSCVFAALPSGRKQFSAGLFYPQKLLPVIQTGNGSLKSKIGLRAKLLENFTHLIVPGLFPGAGDNGNFRRNSFQKLLRILLFSAVMRNL